jgi:cell division protein FtsI (penicillin-binding protein 3)
MVTLAAALEAGTIDPLRQVDCGMGGIVLGGVRINDHTPFGMLTTQEIIANSSNIGAIKLGMAAGRKRLYDTILGFGFGKPTDIDLPSESSGILRPLDRWTPLAPAYISFGQGISVTALQLTNSFAAIANGGELLRPYIVASIGTPQEGRRVWKRRQVVSRPVARDTVHQIRAILESVVVQGTARKAGLGDYRAAGKTGTAEKAVPGRGYAANKYIASFAGFAPVSRPALAISIVLDEPWPHYHGGDVAAPAFAAIAQRVLLYLGVPPERRKRDDPEALEWVAEVSMTPPAEVPEPALRWRHGDAETSVPEGTVPDLVGLSARQALVRARASGLRLALNGHGAVGRQLPVPGTPVEATGGAVEVWLMAGGP